MTPAAGVPKASADPAATLCWEQVLAWRATRHHLVERAPETAALEVVGDVCGLHAQLASSALFSLWARVDELDADAVERALWEDRSLVKTWAMRGTLHLLPAAEYPLWRAMLGTYTHYRKGSWLRAFGFADEAELDAVIAAVGTALRDGPLDRDSLAAAVADEVGDPDVAERLGDSWGATLKPASFTGRLCYAPSAGQRVQFVHPEYWLGAFDPVDPDRATREVTRRYLAAYGPATRERYARWLGVTPAEAGRHLDALGDDRAVVDVDGERLWVLAEDVETIGEPEPSGAVSLLPRFDPYVVGAPRDEQAVCPAEHVDRVYRSNGRISAAMLVDGRIAGTWEHEESIDSVAVTIEPFEEVPLPVRDGAHAEASRLCDFLDGELELRWKPIP